MGAVALVAMLGIVATVSAKGGFDEFGYNDTARIFNGTGMSWCMGKVGDQAWCDSYLGDYSNDKLVMKWNAAWDACNAEYTPANCAGAWTDNEWNGQVPGGSGEIWHYKIVWQCTDQGADSCIWGDYEILMSQGTAANEHFWDTHAIPNGYGAR